MNSNLQSYYQNSRFSDDTTALLERVVDTYLESHRWDESFVKKLASEDLHLSALQPLQYLNKQRLLLTIILWGTTKLREAAAVLLEQFSSCPLWETFQLSTAFTALNRCLLEEKTDMPRPQQWEEGAAPLEYGDYYSWGSIPQGWLHAELGVIWTAWGMLAGDEKFLEAAHRIAHWQLQILDHHYRPLNGVLACEGCGELYASYSMNYALFHGVALANGDGNMEFVAEKLLAHIREDSSWNKHCSWGLDLADWISKLAGVKVQPVNIPLRKAICDPQLALYGQRGKDYTAVVSCSGGNSGVGSFSYDDVAVVSCGPHYFPLDNASNFGVDNRPDNFFNFEELSDDWSVRLRCCLPVRGINDKGGEGFHAYSGSWVEISHCLGEDFWWQEVEILNSVDAKADMAYVFFIKADSCLIGEDHWVKAGALEHYRGEVKPLEFKGHKESLSLHSSVDPKVQLHLITLSGNTDYWGANFLVAFELPKDSSRYGWKVGIVGGHHRDNRET
ncbi:MAG: hypothetical protein ACQEP8_03430 [Chlamydiota bacterium]